MRALFTDPDRFFANRRDDPSMARPAAVVLCAGLAGLTSTLVLFPALLESATSLGQLVSTLALGFSVLGGIFGVFLVWLLYAGLFHSISLVFDGEGEFRKTVAFVGWGFVPAVFSGLVAGAMTSLVLQGMTVPEDPAAVSGFVRRLRAHPGTKLSAGLATVFTAWQGFIWTFAVKHARRLDLRAAVLTVLGPVAVSIAWSVYNAV